MATNALETYLNDHLAGSRLGVDLADQLRDMSAGTPERGDAGGAGDRDRPRTATSWPS